MRVRDQYVATLAVEISGRPLVEVVLVGLHDGSSWGTGVGVAGRAQILMLSHGHVGSICWVFVFNS